MSQAMGPHGEKNYSLGVTLVNCLTPTEGLAVFRYHCREAAELNRGHCRMVGEIL